MIAALDVHYDEAALTGKAAAVLFASWEDFEPYKEYSVVRRGIEAYVPGEFFKRELPCLLKVLADIPEPLDVIVVDGYVSLGGRPGLGLHLWESLDRKVPVIFMRALPFTFSSADADVGSIVTVAVIGEAGGNWQVERRENGWEQIAESPRSPAAAVTMDQDTAWRLVSKRRSREANRQQFPGIQITGNEALGLHVLDMVSVMA